MTTGKTLFAQLMDFLPWTTFSRASFMLITILAMINPHLNSHAISFPQAHSWLEKRAALSLSPHWIKQR